MAKKYPSRNKTSAQGGLKSAKSAARSAKISARSSGKEARDILRAAKSQARSASKLAKNQAREAAAMGRALKRIGLYKTNKPLSIRGMTKRRAATIAKKFQNLQKHAISEHGKTIRPLYRGERSYKLNDRFKVVKSRNKTRKGIGVIPTNKGAIVEVKDKETKVKKIEKDGTIVLREKRFGTWRDVYTGTMTPKQELAFVESVLNGTFQFPKGFYITVSTFGGDTKPLFTLEQLRHHLIRIKKIFDSGNGRGINVLTVEYVKLTRKEMQQQKHSENEEIEDDEDEF